MDMEKKVAGLFMLGFEGYTVNNPILDLIEKAGICGVILFKRNIKDKNQLMQLTASLKEAGPDLLISVDQEGGRVSRIPFLKYPAAYHLGCGNSEKTVYDSYAAMAKELSLLGINMDMAPVLDVNTNPDNPVIGDRAFGKTPERVARFGLAAIKGLQDNGIIACGKHFPGHGDASEDSHLTLPVVKKSRAALDAVELVPFKKAVDNNIASLMTAHLLYPSLDNRPATVSKKILNILRDEMGYNGVVITDDLDMGAVANSYSLNEAVLYSLTAGADMMLVCASFDKQAEVIESLSKKVADNTALQKRVAESFNRIENLK